MIIKIRNLHQITQNQAPPVAGFFVCGMMGRFGQD